MSALDLGPRTACPPSLPRNTSDSWRRLEIATVHPATFDADRVTHLPAAVSRWLRHAIEPGTPLRYGISIAMHGTIRIKRWLPFTSVQIVSSDGYIWAADAGWGPIRIRGFDRFTDGTAEMRWRLFGLVPVMTSSGSDTTRSAAGRHASEMIGLTPAGALAHGVIWQAIDDHRATATTTVGAFTHEVTINVDDAGVLRSASLPRWGNPDSGPFQDHTFGVVFDGEQTIDGYSIATSMRAGWWFGTERWAEGEFFRCTVDGAEFR